MNALPFVHSLAQTFPSGEYLTKRKHRNVYTYCVVTYIFYHKKVLLFGEKFTHFTIFTFLIK